MKILSSRLQIILLLLLILSCETEFEDNFCPGLRNCFSSTISASCSPCIIFVTSNTTNGNLGGVSGADSFCNSDPNKPNSSNYKAMIVSGAIRRACTSANCLTLGTAEHIDWVLKPSVVYQRSDSTIIATTTTEGVFSFNLTNSVKGGVASAIWTGLASDWTNDSNHCLNWTSANAIDTGRAGDDGHVSSFAINRSNVACNSSIPLYCVEQ